MDREAVHDIVVESMASRIDELTTELLVARAKCEGLEKALAVDVEFHRKERDRFDSFRRAVRDHGAHLAEDSVAVQEWKSTLMVLDFWYSDREVEEEEK